MNTLNRVIVILDILITMVVITLILAFPVQVLSITLQFATSSLRLIARIKPEYLMPFYVLPILVAVLLDFLLILWLISELRGPRRKSIRVSSVTGGEVRITIDSIANRLRYHIDPLPDVLAVKPRVSHKRDGVILSLEVEASADVNVPRKAEEVLEVTRQVIEEKMGLKLAGKPQIQIRMVPYPPGSTHATPVRQLEGRRRPEGYQQPEDRRSPEETPQPPAFKPSLPTDSALSTSLEKSEIDGL